MAVVLETTLGDITIDLYINERPKACLNFLKLCRIKYYNFNLFHTVNQGFIAQTGDPSGSRNGGESIWGVMEGASKRYFEAENTPRIKHTTTGLVSFVGDKDSMIGSQFFITLAPDLTYLDSQHCVFGEVTEGFEVLRLLNEAICDSDHRPYQDIRITHTVVLEDPFPDPEKLQIPDGSPEPTVERLQGGRIAPDEVIDETEGKAAHEVIEIIAEKEAKARATILEMIGDIPDAEMAPPENVLFVCKLNPVTTDDDLEIIFSRFGKIKSCEVIRDKKTGDSLQYAFVEFEEQKSCEDAYFKMDNVLIDDRRIHVDFSQSVAKVKWHGKGRGVTHYNDKGEKQKDDPKNQLGSGNYTKQEKRTSKEESKYENNRNRNHDFKDKRNNRRYEQNYSRNYNDYKRDRSRRSRSRSRDQRFRVNEKFNRKDYYKRQNERNIDRRYKKYEEYRRKKSRSRSQSRNNKTSKYDYENHTKKRDENIKQKQKMKSKKKDKNSSDESSSEESNSRKIKKKQHKKKKRLSNESNSTSESDDKKIKKKSKKYESDSSSDSSKERKKRTKKY